MIKRYLKKPVQIEAVQWTGDNLQEVTQFLGNNYPVDTGTQFWEEYKSAVEEEGLCISTLEGDLTASIGDYIIKGVQGEFYPCKPDIFLQSYEPLDGP